MQTIFVADAYCCDGKRFVVHADEKLTAFRELEGGDSRSRGSRTLDGEAMKLILDGSADLGCCRWSNAR